MFDEAHCNTCEKVVPLPHSQHVDLGRNYKNVENAKKIMTVEEIKNLATKEVKKIEEERLKIRYMARFGQIILSQDSTQRTVSDKEWDAGMDVMNVAKAIDECEKCSSYIWTESSNEKPRLSIKRLVLYHFGDHV